MVRRIGDRQAGLGILGFGHVRPDHEQPSSVHEQGLPAGLSCVFLPTLRQTGAGIKAMLH
jgi:hypothetical protein